MLEQSLDAGDRPRVASSKFGLHDQAIITDLRGTYDLARRELVEVGLQVFLARRL
jgi:hypothetical protein